MYNILRRRGLLDRPREKSLFPSKLSLTASRYISQDDDAISEHSRVTSRRCGTQDTERYWSAVKRDVNCRGRRKMLETGVSSRVATDAGIALSKKQKSKWESKQVFEKLLSTDGKEIPVPVGFPRLEDVIMPHYYSIKRQRRRFRS